MLPRSPLVGSAIRKISGSSSLASAPRSLHPSSAENRCRRYVCASDPPTPPLAAHVPPNRHRCAGDALEDLVVSEPGNTSGRPPTRAGVDEPRQTGAPARTSRDGQSSGTNDDHPRAAPHAMGSSRRRDDQLLVGRLTEHGRANYQFRADQDASYYLKLLTSRGSKTLWGKYLESGVSEWDIEPKTADVVSYARASLAAVPVTSRK